MTCLFHNMITQKAGRTSCTPLVRRRRKVLNMGRGGRGGQGSEYWGGGGQGGGGKLFAGPQSVPNNYISHIEN